MMEGMTNMDMNAASAQMVKYGCCILLDTTAALLLLLLTHYCLLPTPL
jgi:hypothetical protein